MKGLYRYYKRQKIELTCRTLTPMFLGDAFQEAEWRAAPFKSLFRYWWRISRHGKTVGELKAEEGEIFGAAGEKDVSAKSPMSIAVLSDVKATMQPIQERLKTIEHPEYSFKGSHEVDPLLYLANMGLMGNNGIVRHSYFPEGAGFRLTVEFPEKLRGEISGCLTFLKAFGTIGGRSRNGWGSFTFCFPEEEEMVKSDILQRNAIDWALGLEKDYPNCMGEDERGGLVWKTADQDTWGKAMRELADTYIGVRARTVGKYPKLNPGGKEYPDERHLLGFPLQNHPANRAGGWGNSGRHAAALRFTVKKSGNSYQGIILHLPFLFSRKMNPMPKADQLRVWERVHRKLDALLSRATWKECLS